MGCAHLIQLFNENGYPKLMRKYSKISQKLGTRMSTMNYKNVGNPLNCSELKTLKWDILNPVLLINLEINNKRRASII